MRKPRKRKTFEELTALNDNEMRITDDGIVFALYDKEALPTVSYSDLLIKFYKRNYRLSPLAVRLVSNHQGPLIEKAWWVVMYANFYLEIEQGSETSGPHRCRLWFRTFTTPVVSHWLATAQLMVFFFNEDEIRKSVKELIATKAFYMASVNADIMVQP